MQFVIEDEYGCLYCECGAEIMSDGYGNLPEVCPVCGEHLDYILVDREEEAYEVTKLLEKAAAYSIIEMPDMYTVILDREVERTEHPLYEAVKKLLVNENLLSLLKETVASVGRLRSEAYDRYCTDWMRDRGIGVHRLLSDISKFAKDSDMHDRISPNAIQNLFYKWEMDHGFGGSIWACYEEFVAEEYKDLAYMLALLPGNQHNDYLRDYCRLTACRMATLYVNTMNGGRRAERCLIDNSAPVPRLIRLNKMTEPRVLGYALVPDMLLWMEATIREDSGREYTMSKNEGRWVIADVTF